MRDKTFALKEIKHKIMKENDYKFIKKFYLALRYFLIL